MLDTSNWQMGPPFQGEDFEDSRLLNEMAGEARAYIHSFRWAPEIEHIYFGGGVGKVIVPFLIRFSQKLADDADHELWVIVGDLPSAYLVTDHATNPRRAVEVYCSLMDEWVDAVRLGNQLDEVFLLMPRLPSPTPKLSQVGFNSFGSKSYPCSDGLR